MKIATYTLTELSEMYFPNSTQRSALNQLKRWINYNNQLLSALEQKGYQNKQRYLTPAQVKLIIEYLGEP